MIKKFSLLLSFLFSFMIQAQISELTKEAMKNPPKDPIHFYYPTMPYFEFTNFWDKHPVTIDGKVWPTTEHYYMAQKFIGPNAYLQEKIRNMQTPDEVFKLAHTHIGSEKDKIRKDWNDILVDVMRKALQAKFTQHPELMDVLKSTGKSLIVEHSEKDSFWGDGHKPVTPLSNWLGKLLMEIRDGVTYKYDPADWNKK